MHFKKLSCIEKRPTIASSARKSNYLPKIRAVRAVVPEELSREAASAKAWSAFRKALLMAFFTQMGK
jgi:hypothetical protein